VAGRASLAVIFRAAVWQREPQSLEPSRQFRLGLRGVARELWLTRVGVGDAQSTLCTGDSSYQPRVLPARGVHPSSGSRPESAPATATYTHPGDDHHDPLLEHKRALF